VRAFTVTDRPPREREDGRAPLRDQRPGPPGKISVTLGRRVQSNGSMGLAASLEQLKPEVLVSACAGDRESLEELLQVIQRPFTTSP